MSAHFTYPHLPAVNLGARDPLRPYVTGGIGRALAVEVLITIMSRLLWAIILNDRLTRYPVLTDGSAGLLLDDDGRRIQLEQESRRIVMDDR